MADQKMRKLKTISFDKKSLIIKSISMAYWENPPD